MSEKTDQRKELSRLRSLAGYGRYYWINTMKVFRRWLPGRHQLTSTTSYNRYPEIFTTVRNAFKGHRAADLKILSYGCSTGEECFTLNEYFPGATIIGADISRLNLARAAWRNRQPNIGFIYSSDENLRAHAPYHLIFCMSVLCRWEDTKDLDDCGHIYPFDKFHATVTELASLLAEGGILVIYNSNFRFEDTDIFSNFEIIPAPVTNSGFVHKFDRNNKRLTEVHRNCLYRKISS
jgi:hypothetical protein